MGAIDAYVELKDSIDAQVTRDELMAHHTSYRVGGRVGLMVQANSYAALVRTLDVLGEQSVPWVILGRGTNVLVSDDGFDGCVITLGRDFQRISVANNGSICAGGGTQLARVVNEAMKAELTGLECCVGIPGTVGGAIAMNAGTRNEWIDSVVESVVVYRPNKGLARYDVSDLEWGYRYCSLPPAEIVLEVVFSLDLGERKAIAQTMEGLLRRRNLTQPVGKPTCGSVFRNPGSKSAAKLIEECGLKGYSCGQAEVSGVHANFVINNGGATAADVVAVMRHVHETVRREQGVDLLCEVKFLGFGA